MEHLSFRAMGCAMRATLAVAAADGPAALERVPGWFAEWEAHLSRFREDSELVRLNAAAGHPMRVSTVFWDVLEAALASAKWTDGLATPTLLDAVERAGYDRSFEALVADGRIQGRGEAAPRGVAAKLRHQWLGAGVATPPDWRDISTDAATRTVRLPAGMRLDFGGTAKGWAADEAARRLAVQGPALVDAGGDIAVSGPRAGGERWPVAVASPFQPDHHLAVLWLGRGGVATSGRDFRRWQRGGQWQHHIIDPRTGEPAATDVQSATVVARSAGLAEAAAKTALILGSRRGLAWIEAHPPLAALVVTEDGEVHTSRRLAAYLGG
jgi:thiamine biosynthesis lipoprotein